MSTERAAKIAALNDEFRRRCVPPQVTLSGRLMITAGVNALGGDAVLEILNKVARFDAFTGDNDPWKERDFGSVEHDGATVFWKFDYFADASLEFRSEDPADPSKTTRVLTIMLDKEY